MEWYVEVLVYHDRVCERLASAASAVKPDLDLPTSCPKHSP